MFSANTILGAKIVVKCKIHLADWLRIFILANKALFPMFSKKLNKALFSLKTILKRFLTLYPSSPIIPLRYSNRHQNQNRKLFRILCAHEKEFLTRILILANKTLFSLRGQFGSVNYWISLLSSSNLTKSSNFLEYECNHTWPRGDRQGKLLIVIF